MIVPRTTYFRLLRLLPTLLMAACAQPAHTPAQGSLARFQSPDLRRPLHSDQPSAPSPFLRGTAIVVSVDQTSGHALLNIQGRRVEAYWQTEIASAQGGSTNQTDLINPAVGIYRESDVRSQSFDACPGDTIAFVGMRTGNSIFLQSIAVISP